MSKIDTLLRPKPPKTVETLSPAEKEEYKSTVELAKTKFEELVVHRASRTSNYYPSDILAARHYDSIPVGKRKVWEDEEPVDVWVEPGFRYTVTSYGVPATLELAFLVPREDAEAPYSTDLGYGHKGNTLGIGYASIDYPAKDNAWPTDLTNAREFIELIDDISTQTIG